MKQILDEIYGEIKKAHNDAKLFEKLWHIEIARRELSRHERGVVGKERTNYHFRIVMTATSFVCIWERVQFVLRSNKTVRLVKKIPVQENGKINIAYFKHAEDWEIKLIKEMEEYMVGIRLTVRQLMKAHQNIIKLKQMIGLEVCPLKSKDFLVPTTSSIKLEKERIMGK